MARTKQTTCGGSSGLSSAGAGRGGGGDGDGAGTSTGGFTLATFVSLTRSSPRRRATSNSLARSSPRKRSHKTGAAGLPSFSTSEESDFLSANKQMDDDEVSFKSAGSQPLKSDPPKTRSQVASKNLTTVKNLLRAPKRGPSGLTLLSKWNKFGKHHTTNETKRGWLKKTTKNKNKQGRLLRRNRPGTVALREIHFYQRSRVFLIPMHAFQRYIREVCMNVAKEMHWQAEALFNLQVAAEAFLTGFLCDTNLCAIHRKCITIFPKDLFLAKHLRGRSNTGAGLSDQDS